MRLEALGDRDPLTGLYRRRRLDEELRRQLAFAERQGARVAALDLCLDGFEDTRDAYGRVIADELLDAAAEALREGTRESDLIAYGDGGDFLLVLPGSDEESARIVAGKLIRSLRGVIRPRPDGGVIELRASIGLALSRPGSDADAEALLGDAERARERAQAEGGDRFSTAEALVLH